MVRSIFLTAFALVFFIIYFFINMISLAEVLAESLQLFCIHSLQNNKQMMSTGDECSNAEYRSVCLCVRVDTIADEIGIPSVFTSYYASQILGNIIPERG